MLHQNLSPAEIDTAGIRTRVDRAAAAIAEAKKLNDAMQRAHTPGTTEWHEHEALDDKLFNALTALGE